MIYSVSELELYLIFSTCYHNPALLHYQDTLGKKKHTQQVKDNFSTDATVDMHVQKCRQYHTGETGFKKGFN